MAAKSTGDTSNLAPNDDSVSTALPRYLPSTNTADFKRYNPKKHKKGAMKKHAKRIMVKG